MIYFQNPLFMANIIKGQGATQYFQSTQLSPMLTAIEMQTRLVLQTAIKFMKKGRTAKLASEDIQMAAREMGHEEMNLIGAPPSRLFKDGRISIADLVESCGYNLSNHVEKSQLKGRWIYCNEEVVESGFRLNIKKLKRQDRETVLGKKASAFNVITMGSGESEMTKQQHQYIKKLELQLALNRKSFDGKIEGRVRLHFHLFLELIRKYPNSAGLKTLMYLFNHSGLDHDTILYNIHKVIEILMVYRGPQAYKVGGMIVEFVDKYKHEQPQLLQLFQDQKDDYSYLIKAIAFESVLGLQTFSINLQRFIRKARRQGGQGDGMASLCLRLLMKNIQRIAAFCRQKTCIPLDLPHSYMHNDRYLNMY